MYYVTGRVILITNRALYLLVLVGQRSGQLANTNASIYYVSTINQSTILRVASFYVNKQNIQNSKYMRTMYSI